MREKFISLYSILSSWEWSCKKGLPSAKLRRKEEINRIALWLLIAFLYSSFPLVMLETKIVKV